MRLLDRLLRRRPAEPDYTDMHEPIPDTPENIARALLMSPPEDDWVEEEVDGDPP